MTQFFMQDGDETRLKNAQLADDMDLISSQHFIGPWGPELVAVAMHSGVHVCWYCHDMFQGHRAKRPIEVRHGHVLVLLHAGCHGKKPRTFEVVNDLVRGHQLRREAARLVKASAGLDAATGAGESDSPLSLDNELFASARNLLKRAAGEIQPGEPPDEDADDYVDPDAPLIQLAEGLDTLTPREAPETESSDNSEALKVSSSQPRSC